MQNTGRPQPQYPVEAVDRALRLLGLFREQPELRLSVVRQRLGVGQSTAHRLMAITTSRELVLNGDFETGPWAADFAAAVAPAGWGSQGTAVTYAAGIGTPGALTSDPMSDGGLAYYAGGPSTVLSQNSQYLDLTAFASAIDSGTASSLSNR